MARPTTRSCPGCGSAEIAPRFDPTLGLSFVVLGATVILDAVGGRWDAAGSAIHYVGGGLLVAAGGFGLVRDSIQARAGLRTSGYWMTDAGTCSSCGTREGVAGEIRVARVAMAFAAIAAVALRLARG